MKSRTTGWATMIGIGALLFIVSGSTPARADRDDHGTRYENHYRDAKRDHARCSPRHDDRRDGDRNRWNDSRDHRNDRHSGDYHR